MMSFPRAGRHAPRVLALALAWAQAALAQAPAPAAAPPAASSASAPKPAPQPSALTAELFYQLLVGELNARGDDPGAGFSLLLDAARKTQDPTLYQRAVEIALQARAGESALQAARAWKQAHPASRDANRFVLQILLALNRVGDTLEPLRTEVALAPVIERSVAISMLPRLYARAGDKRQAAAVVEQALADALARPDTATAAWTAVGRMRLAAGDGAGALEAARRGQAAGPTAEGPVLLALELMESRQAQAETLVRRYLDGAAPLPEVRMAYARALLDLQRQADAREQLRTVTTQRPEVAEAWLMQGVLQAQGQQHEAAEASLKRYLELSRAQAEAGTREERNRGLAQAYLNLAQIAEKRGDLAQANAWLDRIQSPQDLVATQNRRASILARQGRMDEARRLLRELPERSPEDARTKLMAEAQLLRDHRQFQAAYDLLGEAAARGPADVDLLYEQALVAEKLGRFADMERLLRQAIARKPDFHHALNALGYSFAERGIRLQEARELIRKALDLSPGDPFIIDSLAWVEFRMGNKAEAQRLLEQAYRERPDAEIAAHLGEVLWSLGLRERAQAIWREGLLLNRENETLQETLKRLRVRP
ncbi:tetratricopeptide repeat protein [Ramlibacter sp. GCM10027632]|uniref:tetratricopeptide repeat protein n=2 Tax=unclassified Ramlibacter TaxID=2617605 RepID=UPI003636ADEF